MALPSNAVKGLAKKVAKFGTKVSSGARRATRSIPSATDGVIDVTPRVRGGSAPKFRHRPKASKSPFSHLPSPPRRTSGAGGLPGSTRSGLPVPYRPPPPRATPMPPHRGQMEHVPWGRHPGAPTGKNIKWKGKAAAGSAAALGGLALQRNRSGKSQGLPPRVPGSETGMYGR